MSHAEIRKAVRAAMNELGVPTDDYPAPVANAYEILERLSAELAVGGDPE